MLLIFFTIVMIPQNQSILQKISNFFQSQTLFTYHWYMWCDLIKFSTDMYICNNCWTLCLCIYERLWTQTFPHSLILYTMTKKHEVKILFNVMPEIYEAFRCVCPRRVSFAKCYWLRFFFSVIHPDQNHHAIPDKDHMIWYLTPHEEHTCLPITSWSMTLWMILKTLYGFLS